MLTIATEDRITWAEVRDLWPRLRSRVLEYARASKMCDPGDLQQFQRIEASLLAPLLILYPPVPQGRWWDPTGNLPSSVHNAIRGSLIALFELVHLQNNLIVDAKVRVDPRDLPDSRHLPAGLAQIPIHSADIIPLSTDSSRFLHRLTLLARTVVRYGRHLLPQELEVYVDVERDEYGVIPCGFGSDGEQQIICMLAYIQACDANGNVLLVPCALDHPVNASSSDVAGSRFILLEKDGGVMLAWHPKCGLLSEPGFLVHKRKATKEILASGNHIVRGTEIRALKGFTGNSQTSWRTGDIICFKPTVLGAAQARQFLEHPNVAPTMAEGHRFLYQDLVRAREGFTIVDMLREMQGDDWPAVGERRYIATPRPGMEEQLLELFIMEELAQQADSDPQVQLLLEHLLEETGAETTEGLLSAQRRKLEQMLEDQQAQLRIHAEAVQRAQQRSARMKAFSQSASDGLSASAVTPSAVPAASVALSTQSYAPGIATRAAEVTASWTADSRYSTLESLRTPGRLKYAPWLRAVTSIVRVLNPQRISQHGSHRVCHFAGTGPVTFVIPHSGGSNDSTISKKATTRLFGEFLRVLVAQGGASASEVASTTI